MQDTKTFSLAKKIEKRKIMYKGTHILKQEKKSFVGFCVLRALVA
jgi:hypothetical protein